MTEPDPQEHPLLSPEARKHKRDCRVVERKLTEFLTDPDVFMPEGRPEMPEESNGRPALSVNPTRQNDGRVRMSIPQLAALIGLPVADLTNPDESLIDLLSPKGRDQ